MGCSMCRYLERAFESRNREYLASCSSTYSRISSRFVAYDIVEMERARSELAMHRSVCVSALDSKHEAGEHKATAELAEASRS